MTWSASSESFANVTLWRVTSCAKWDWQPADQTSTWSELPYSSQHINVLRRGVVVLIVPSHAAELGDFSDKWIVEPSEGTRD